MRRRGEPLAGLILLAALGTVLRWSDPRANAWIRCPFHLLTGLDCPGCGSLRAVHRLVHGDVGAALDHNAALVVVLPVAVLTWSWRLVRAQTPAIPRWKVPLDRAVLVLVVGWTVVRNVPVGVFAFFAA